MKLPLLAFCLLNLTQLSAQFKLRVDVGYAHAIFNKGQSSVMPPAILGSNVPTTQRVEIRANANRFLALGVEYAPPENTLAWEFRLQYLSRGYDISIIDQHALGLATSFTTTRGHYLDALPAATYYFSSQFSLQAGPYLSLLLSSEDEFFLSNDDRRISKTDYGINLGTTLSKGKFHLRMDYQRSLRNLIYPIYDINISTAKFYNGSAVSLLRVGIGYTILRPDRGLEAVPKKPKG